jgi:gamma-glutamyltranspeptidase/glutathione hydrolase
LVSWVFAVLCLVGMPLAAAEIRVDASKPAAAAIASAHPLATEAGHRTLESGGNAFDAAVTVSAVLAVVEPYSSGLGGGGFWLLHRASDGLELMLDGRERAPLAAHRDMYLDGAGNPVSGQSIDGPLAAAIPGQPAALVHLARHYGRLPLEQSLAPAIRLARNGFAVDGHYLRMAQWRLDVLRKSPAAADQFLHANEVPAEGHLLRQPELADTLGALAKQGRKGFYAGPVAEKLVAGVRAAGGIWTLEDLRRYRVAERPPVRGSYRGMTITSAAPPSSGGIVLVEMLNVLAAFDLQSLSPEIRKHLLIEAMRRAYRDRAEYLGDPDFVDMPTPRLLHPFYGRGLARGIRLDRVTASRPPEGLAAGSAGRDTTHFSILDADGNRVAATLSINYPFGSGFVPPGTGVLLNDEMDDFSVRPGVPNVYGLIGGAANAIQPGKRMLSSMTPTFVESDRGVAILGTPGGSRIITMLLHAVLALAEGRGPEAWVEQPRFHHQYLPDKVEFEAGALSPAELAGLKEKGHVLEPLNRRYGNMQAVYWDRRTGLVSAASDPRGMGTAEVR